MYLPIFDLNKNVIKKSALNFNKKLSNFYRITYLNFPVIPESEILCYNNQQVYNWINEYQIKFDVYLNYTYLIKNSLDFLLRLFRFPIEANFVN